jgi:hypothetical protein
VELRLVVLLENPQVADELRDVLIGVPAVEDVLVGDDRLVDGGVDEALRGGHVVGLPRAGARERRQRVVDAAELAGDVAVPHAIELRLRQRRQPAVRPVGDLRGDVERLRVPGVRVRVDEAREDLVERVVRRPDAGLPPYGANSSSRMNWVSGYADRKPGCRRASVGAMMRP